MAQEIGSRVAADTAVVGSGGEDGSSALMGFTPLSDEESHWRMALRTSKESLPFMLRHFLVRRFAGSELLPPVLRVAVLRALGMRFTPPLLYSRVSWLGAIIDSPRNISVGRGAGVAMGCYFEGEGDVTLGDESGFGPRVTVVTSAHVRLSDGYVDREVTYLPVTIGRRSWVATGAILMPGVSIGDDVTIAAGSVVTKDCLAPGVYGGVPARRIK